MSMIEQTDTIRLAGKHARELPTPLFDTEVFDSSLEHLRELRIAIVHYWLLRMRGGEKAAELLCELFPNADIYTLFYDPKQVWTTISRHTVTASFLQRLPGSRH